MSIAIRVDGVSLNYTAPDKRSIRSLRIFSNRKNRRTIQALKDVSFTVEQGEILGIIGTNGSGKSTMLKVLNGVLAHDAGTIDLYGNSVSLLSLGVGFNPELSGHDNVFLSGLLLGFTEAEIREQYNEIVAFAELGDAIYQPVKTYSSGMHSKLAFSIAVTLKTDILLIDEVLSVGDLQFRQRSQEKMRALMKEPGRTVIIVSHNLTELQQLCDRVLWLEKGRMRAIGPASEVLDAYREEMSLVPANSARLEEPRLKVTPKYKSVLLQWKPVEHAVDYRVYRKEMVEGSRWTPFLDGYPKTELLDENLSSNIAYVYTARARAETPDGRSIWSEFIPSAQVRPLAEPPAEE